LYWNEDNFVLKKVWNIPETTDQFTRFEEVTKVRMAILLINKPNLEERKKQMTKLRVVTF
jgi:hypothetical protein